MPARRPCPTPGCPALITRTQRACPACARASDQQRGTRQQRGYDADYDRQRRAWKTLVDTGQGHCWRCGAPIPAGSDWHLGHDDRRKIVGPEHRTCNESAAGRQRHLNDP